MNTEGCRRRVARPFLLQHLALAGAFDCLSALPKSSTLRMLPTALAPLLLERPRCWWTTCPHAAAAAELEAPTHKEVGSGCCPCAPEAAKVWIAGTIAQLSCTFFLGPNPFALRGTA